MNVYLVEDTGNSPGLIYGVFAEQRAAIDYMNHLEHLEIIDGAQIVERKLHYGQQHPAASKGGVLP